jgi:hypothetical protein
VRKGRHYGRKFPADYIEVRYEDLVCHPEKTLTELGEFLDHDLDYGRIQKTAVGRVASPNTIWNEESAAASFRPINRWKAKLTQSEIADLEVLIGDGLEEFRYSVTAKRRGPSRLKPTLSLMRMFYPGYFDIKLFLQSKTVVGRIAKGTRLELADPV